MSESAQLIGKTVQVALRTLEKEVQSRSYRASNELRNSALHVLRGQRTGRQYRVPFTNRKYTASAPGEAPAMRTGIFRLSWATNVRVEKHGSKFYCISAIESNVRVGKHLLGDILEYGTKVSGRQRMAPRPYKQAVRDRAAPKIKEIYKKPFKV